MDLLAVLLLATAIALLRRPRSWPALALLAALWFVLCFLSLGFLGMAIPSLLLAQAIAVRWRLGLPGEAALLLLAAVVWAIGGLVPFALIDHLRRSPLPWISLPWLLYAGLFAGFAALARSRPPWSRTTFLVRKS